jgi:DNA-binding Xre family transcriptional regulator
MSVSYGIKGKAMAISYKKLWKQLIEKDMSKTDLRIKADLGTGTLAKLGKNQQVSLDVLLRICKVLECDIAEIMEVINKENDNG